MSFIKQLIVLALGSFIFLGVLENYKSDESIKIKQLEDYFKPAREAANACLKKQNELFLHYPNYGGSLKLVFNELNYFMKNPELDGNQQYRLVLEGYAKNMHDTQKRHKELPPAVDKCREEVFLKLEALSIATGTFEYFSELSKKRSSQLNRIDKEFRNKLKKSNQGMGVENIINMMRKFGTINFRSESEVKKLRLDFGNMLPLVESYGIYLAEAEQKKYHVESEFFGGVREMSATKINSRFKQGFFSWLFK